MTVRDKDSIVLSPLKENSKNTHYMRYWEGYPFDIGYTKVLSGVGQNIVRLTNLSNGISTPDFISAYDVNRIFISNGDINTTIESHMPIRVGHNLIKLNDDNFVELVKSDSMCGTYIKWLNQSGGYSYWLFNASQDNVSSKSIGNVNNDFYNVRDSKSQFKSLGRTTTVKRTLRYEHLSLDDIRLLETILDSPRISLYTGERFSPNPQGRNWIDVSIDSKNLLSRNFKGKVPDGNITINLPERYTIKL